jgi:hypothetical protein
MVQLRKLLLAHTICIISRYHYHYRYRYPHAHYTTLYTFVFYHLGLADSLRQNNCSAAAMPPLIWHHRTIDINHLLQRNQKSQDILDDSFRRWSRIPRSSHGL